MPPKKIFTHGVFQTGTVMGLEIHVRDTAHLRGGWEFFSFDGTGPAPLRPRSASCYTCYPSHGPVDTSFVQFCPTLIPVARARRAYHEDANPPGN